MPGSPETPWGRKPLPNQSVTESVTSFLTIPQHCSNRPLTSLLTPQLRGRPEITAELLNAYKNVVWHCGRLGIFYAIFFFMSDGYRYDFFI